MHEFIQCLTYLAFIGVIGFSVGRALPKKWFNWCAFPWNSFKMEKDGRLYAWLKVKKWQNKLPDMSKLFKKLMPPKALTVCNSESLSLMLRETCVAELIHILLCIFALPCLKIWKGIGGITITLLYIFGNIPFIIIQRFNRPRLNNLLTRFEESEPHKLTN